MLRMSRVEHVGQIIQRDPSMRPQRNAEDVASMPVSNGNAHHLQ